MEVWKDIPFVNGEYSVSSEGRVKRNKTGRILKQSMSVNSFRGYKVVTLFRYDRNRHFKVHRLVAETFIPNADKLRCVNHIDGNKLNNRVSNLEWVSDRGNSRHAHDTGLMDNQHGWCESKKKPIIARNIETGEEIYYDSILSAKKAIKSNHIQEVLNGKREMAKGYYFRYAIGGDA